MLAVMAGHRGEFVKATASVLSGKRLVAIPGSCKKLMFRHFAYASRRAIPPQLFDSILLRQCAGRNS